MDDNVAGKVWVLGATGRSGQAVARELTSRGITPVMVGRNASRLDAVAAGLRAESFVAGSVGMMAESVQLLRPAVVINTVGPFAETTQPIAEACVTARADYVDLANDAGSALALLNLHDDAVAAGVRLVTGAGFGVTATESVVARLCESRETPIRVRVDMIPSLAVESAAMGDALAATIVEGLPGIPGGGRFESRWYTGGVLTGLPMLSQPLTLTLPSGDVVTTACMPLGELVAAQRVSGAPEVICATSEVPTSRFARVVIPRAFQMLADDRLRRLARERLAAVQFRARPAPREHSWGHATVEWADGTRREGWVRVGDASVYTAAASAEVARRLLGDDAPAGAWTPVALLGTSLVEACGADFIDA